METKYFKCSENYENIITSTIGQMFDWIRSDELKNIVKAFGGEISQTDDIKVLVDWLLDFSDIWDYRRKQQKAFDEETKEAARWLVSNDDITNIQVEKIFEATDVLGLTGVNEPMIKSYDYVVALGGARLSCLLRPKYASYIITGNLLHPKAVIMLSGTRPISDTEREATNTYAPDAITEFDLINKGAEIAFEVSGKFKENRYDDRENMNKSWAIRTYDEERLDYSLISIAGPSTEPDKRRANSADTYKFFFEKYNVQPGEKLLLVTSEIYVPYQQLEAIRTLALPYGVVVETVGFPNNWSGKIHGMKNPVNYLQEIRSTIQAMSRFINFYKKGDI